MLCTLGRNKKKYYNAKDRYQQSKMLAKKTWLTLMGTEHKYVKIGPGPIVPNNLVATAEQKHHLNSCEVGEEV